MSLTHGLLGLLTYNKSTGYDLAKIFSDSLNFFWNAQASQIYRELNRMEEHGWVMSESVIQDGRPNKRLYSITKSGEDELHRWLSEFQFVQENHHHALLMRVFFANELEAEETISLLKECHRACMEGITVMETMAQNNINNYAQTVTGGIQKKLYWQMTLEFGIGQTKAMAEWTLNCIKKIEKELAK